MKIAIVLFYALSGQPGVDLEKTKRSWSERVSACGWNSQAAQIAKDIPNVK